MAAKDGGKSRQPPRRRWVEPGAAPRAHVRRKAEELMRDAGLPLHLAMRVAKDEIKLQEALTQMGDKDRVEKLIARHEIDRSLATQVVLGRVSLDDILTRRRLKQHIADHRSRSILDTALADGRHRVFGLHGHRLVLAKVVGVTPFGVELEASAEDARSGGLGSLHKLQFKYAAETEDLESVQAAIQRDSEIEVRDPIERPQDRYRCANKRLFSWLDAETDVEIATLEGDRLRGPLNWIGRWELGMSVGKDLEIVLFRHAIGNISGG